MKAVDNPSKFLDKFRGLGFQKRGVLFFSPDIALDLIDEAEKAGVSVVGVDTFTVKLRSTEPHSEHSIDLSGSDDGGWKAARELIAAKRHLGFVFELVFEEAS